MGTRICLVRHAYFPDDTHERRQVSALLEAGYQVDVICLRRPGQWSFERVDGARVYRLPIRHRRSLVVRYFVEYGASFVSSWLLLTILHLKKAYQLVQVNTMPDFLVFAAIIPRLFGVPVLLDLHEPTPELWVTKYGRHRLRILYRLQVLLEQCAIRFATRAITVTPALRNRFGERGADTGKISVVPNVCDDRLFFAQAALKAPRDDAFTLICHGLIEDRYGHDLIVRAVQRLSREIPNLHFAIAGFGEFEETVRKLIRELDCERQVHLLGFLPFDELLEKLRQADVGVIAMRRSPYSELIDTNKMYEYIALKKPVIAARLEAVTDRFDDTCLCFFQAGNAADLARAISELYHHPEKCSLLARNAFARYEAMKWSNSKRIYLEAVRMAIQDSPRFGRARR